MPKVSVVMPAYNAEKYIGEAIDSILNQTFKDFEFIIINDGSKDHTEEIIQSYFDHRIVYLRNEQNRGISDTLNRGLDSAKGEYIARMDSDDISLPERLAKQVEYMDEHKKIGVLGSAVIRFGEGMKESVRELTSDAKQAKSDLFFSSCLSHPTVMIRKSILDNYNLHYSSRYNGMEDYFLWWELSHFTEIVSLREPLLKYRIHAKQITNHVNAEVRDRKREFQSRRLEEFQCKFTEREKMLYAWYCEGAFECFDIENIKAFIRLLRKFIEANQKSNCYPQYQFQHVLELSAEYTIDRSDCNHADKKRLRRYAIGQKVTSPFMAVKLLVHRLIL